MESQDWYRPADGHSVAGQGRPLPLTAVPSPCHPPRPPPPRRTADVRQGLPGAGRHAALNDTFALILHAVMSLLPPTIPTQYIKNMAKACHWINSLNLLQLSNTWQNQLPAVLVCTREECHLEVILHSPFTPNGKSKCQATSKFPCGLTLVQQFYLNI